MQHVYQNEYESGPVGSRKEDAVNMSSKMSMRVDRLGRERWMQCNMLSKMSMRVDRLGRERWMQCNMSSKMSTRVERLG